MKGESVANFGEALWTYGSFSILRFILRISAWPSVRESVEAIHRKLGYAALTYTPKYKAYLVVTTCASGLPLQLACTRVCLGTF